MIETRIVERLSEVPEAAWDALVPPDEPPFVRHAFLDALERTGCVGENTGWAPAHLVFEDEGRLVAAAPAYVKTNSEGEFVFDWAGRISRQGCAFRTIRSSSSLSRSRPRPGRACSRAATKIGCAPFRSSPGPSNGSSIRSVSRARTFSFRPKARRARSSSKASRRATACSSSGTTRGTERSTTGSGPSVPRSGTRSGANAERSRNRGSASRRYAARRSPSRRSTPSTVFTSRASTNTSGAGGI